jgi:hypothetical protein
MEGPIPRRIDAGDVLAAIGALLLIIALFLEWFGEANAWEAFEVLDLLLAALAVAALCAAAAGAGLLGDPSPRILAPLGAALLLIVVVQVVEPPPSFAGVDDVETGGWLALVGAALILLGGLMRVARVSVSVDIGGRDVRRRVPAVDRRASSAPEPGADTPGARPREDAVRVGTPPPAADDPQPTQPFSAFDDR